jgi:ATPase subunit of ABC transporter with duplicated ATPase domains
LQDALTRFGGSVLIVSHDRALLDALETSVEWRFSRVGDVGRVRIEHR